MRIAQALDFGSRETSFLLRGAAFMLFSSGRQMDAEEEEFLRYSLAIALRHQDPNPAFILDEFSNIKMLNRAALHFLKELVNPELLQKPLNLFQLVMKDDGLRPYILHWEDMVALRLLHLYQEILLNDRPEDNLKFTKCKLETSPSALLKKSHVAPCAWQNK
ncbi:MmyB family transcriptional regulator [Desulforhopalus singaporensis]|uniref:MmyB-like transcription regulator ligand binding domain-containing protein n=1 Tax=Desulforhopalus singaporensis TaxID=91360 RepID=A0A1H0NY75_9BACT|nr:hypothetical protein [Desulforhopalus singaporensis]SDO97634.1 hypothetical protein SAMN05660330_01498 [Desulforhopalus singaporensis]